MVESTPNHVGTPHMSVKQSYGTMIGRNRILLLNIFKFIEFKRKALMKLGQLCRKYSIFVKKDMTLFEMFEKEK